MKRIICVGNRYVAEDAAGPLVYDYLQYQPLPPDVEVVDGGIAGLNLLRWVEGMERVVFVDHIESLAETEDPVIVLNAAEVAALASSRYDHAAGLPYLLRMLPDVCSGPAPDVAVVGVGGVLNAATIARAALVALEVANGDG